ncbi:MAG: type I 3-dehydroquinate dehydratase [Candidatus Micrarchaeota archaeon]|nr:type I 3-dehydroquinate dehydratase [Candidatus Micrarchaeota archaeon]
MQRHKQGNFCIVITASEPRLLQRKISETSRTGCIREIRLDSLSDYDKMKEKALKIVMPVKERCVFTLRSASEAGRNGFHEDAMAESDRKAALLELARHKPMLLDVEYNTMKYSHAFAREIADTKANVLVSYHDFYRTPTLNELKEVVEWSSANKFGYIKIATYGESRDDDRTIAKLYDAVPEKMELIAFVMNSRQSRIESLFHGAPFAYVAWGIPNAPGQMTLAEARQEFAKMNGN